MYFGVVRRAQLAKSTFLTSTLVPLGSFQIPEGLFTCEREIGVRRATESYCTYSSLVKLQLWFLRLQWKTCLVRTAALVPEFVVSDQPLGRTL